MRTVSLIFCCAILTSSLGSRVHAQAPHPVADATGMQQNRTYLGELPFEHVDSLTGNVLLTFTDLALPGHGTMDVVVQRTYNSKQNAWTYGLAGFPYQVWNPDGPPPADPNGPLDPP